MKGAGIGYHGALVLAALLPRLRDAETKPKEE